MALSGDTLNRSWVTLDADADDIRQLNNVVVTIAALNEDNCPVAIGNAFVIHSQDNSALCLTAAHVFEEIKRMRSSRSPQSHPTMPSDFRRRGVEHMSSDGCVIIFEYEGKPGLARVGQVNYIEH